MTDENPQQIKHPIVTGLVTSLPVIFIIVGLAIFMAQPLAAGFGLVEAPVTEIVTTCYVLPENAQVVGGTGSGNGGAQVYYTLPDRPGELLQVTLRRLERCE